MDNQDKNIEKNIKRKEKFIGDVVEKKENSIERANVLNNSVVLLKLIKEHNLNEDEVLKTLIKLSRRVARLKRFYDSDLTLAEIYNLLDNPF